MDFFEANPVPRRKQRKDLDEEERLRNGFGTVGHEDSRNLDREGREVVRVGGGLEAPPTQRPRRLFGKGFKEFGDVGIVRVFERRLQNRAHARTDLGVFERVANEPRVAPDERDEVLFGEFRQGAFVLQKRQPDVIVVVGLEGVECGLRKTLDMRRVFADAGVGVRGKALEKDLPRIAVRKTADDFAVGVERNAEKR